MKLDSFITKVNIKKLRHLKNIEIDLGSEKKHLIFTGKNGLKQVLIPPIFLMLERWGRDLVPFLPVKIPRAPLKTKILST